MHVPARHVPPGSRAGADEAGRYGRIAVGSGRLHRDDQIGIDDIVDIVGHAGHGIVDIVDSIFGMEDGGNPNL